MENEAQAVEGTLNEIAEGLILVEPSDLQAVSSIHSLLEKVVTWAEGAGYPRVSKAARACMELAEGIILEDVASPSEALHAIVQAVEAIQKVAGGGVSDGDALFPAVLSVGGPTLPSDAASGDEGGEVDPFFATYQLPAHVDETIFSDFLARQNGVLDEFEELVLALERNVDSDTADAIRRGIHTLKGESALLGLENIERLCHKVEDAMSESGAEKLTDELLVVRDWLGRAFDAYAGKASAPEPVDRIIRKLAGGSSGQPAPPPRAPEPAPQPAPPAAPEAVREAKPLEGDMELMGDFVVEAKEHLDLADVHLLTLETEPENEEAVNAVFRGFHTIKGVAGFLNLDDIQALSHEAENLLDKSRKGEIKLEGPAIDVVFEAVDALKQLVGHVSDALSSGGLLEVFDELPTLLSRIRAVISGDVPPPTPASADSNAGKKVGEILVDEGAATEADVQAALKTQNEPVEPQLIGEILIKYLSVTRAQVDEAVALQNEYPEKKLGELLVEMGATTEDAIEKALSRQDAPEVRRLGEILCVDYKVPAQEVAKAIRSQKAAPQAHPQTVRVREAVKVDADRLDLLIDTIGELVIAESMVSQSPEMRQLASTDLVRQLSQLDKITRELQEMGMGLRMVPVRGIFQKMARLVRDLAKKSGKKVEFRMVGEDTELDKSVVDRIGDPLVHMVRNAVDHGLEATPEARLAAGKPESGTVELRAFHKGGSIYIEIEDDGRGLNRDAILKKAIERQLIRDTDSLSDREIWNLIFEPGFSTAEKVTDVSGRGVGMDVVKRNIEALRGQIEITSESGKGSIFSIRLPLTLAIIDGMVVRVGSERYVIPTLSIVMSVRPDQEDLESVVGRGEMMRLQGNLIPLFRLGRLFNLKDAEVDPTKAIIVVVEDEGKHIGVLIDDILGQQQIVIKSLGETMRDIPGIAGGAIMPDGDVGLILDVGGMVKVAHSDAGPPR